MSARMHQAGSLALASLALSAATVLLAQTTPSSTHAAHHRKQRAAVQPVAPAPAPAVVEPPKPNWPVNDAPSPATVTWDRRSLRVDASNSSLDQILVTIASDTGVKIEGAGADQRIFGVFGPGSPRDVLSQLLQGSGYNIVMVGDNGAGLPREVQLSARRAGNNAPAAMHPMQQQPDDDYSDAPDDSQQMDAAPQQPAMPPEVPHPPQQIIREQELMQQQPGQPPAPQQQQSPQ